MYQRKVLLCWIVLLINAMLEHKGCLNFQYPIIIIPNQFKSPMNNSFTYGQYNQPCYGFAYQMAQNVPYYGPPQVSQSVSNVLPPGSEFINHNPNLKKIQYYAVLEIEVNKSDKELRVDEIIELSFLLVQDSEVLFKKHWYIKPTVFHNVFPQTTDRTGIVIEYLKEKPKIEEVLSNIEAQISKLPLLSDKSDLIFVTAYEDTFTRYLRGETEFKDYSLKAYMKNFIALENQFPAELKNSDRPLTIANMLSALKLREGNYSNRTTTDAGNDTAIILLELLKQGTFSTWQSYTEVRQTNSVRFLVPKPKSLQTQSVPAQEPAKPISQSQQPNAQQPREDAQPSIKQPSSKQVEGTKPGRYGFGEIDVTSLREQNHKEAEHAIKREAKYKRLDQPQTTSQNEYTHQELAKPQNRRNETGYNSEDKPDKIGNSNYGRESGLNYGQNQSQYTENRNYKEPRSNNYSTNPNSSNRNQDREKYQNDHNDQSFNYQLQKDKQRNNDQNYRQDNRNEYKKDEHDSYKNKQRPYSNERTQNYQDQPFMAKEQKNYWKEYNQDNRPQTTRNYDQNKRNQDQANKKIDRSEHFDDNQDNFRPKQLENQGQFAKHRRNQSDYQQDQKNDVENDLQSYFKKPLDQDWIINSSAIKDFTVNNKEQDIDFLLILHLEQAKEGQKGIDEIGLIIYDVQLKTYNQQGVDFFEKVQHRQSDDVKALPIDGLLYQLDDYLRSKKIPLHRSVVATTVHPKSLINLAKDYRHLTQNKFPEFLIRFILIPELFCNKEGRKFESRPKLQQLCHWIKVPRENYSSSTCEKLQRSAQIVHTLTTQHRYQWSSKYVNFRLFDKERRTQQYVYYEAKNQTPYQYILKSENQTTEQESQNQEQKQQKPRKYSDKQDYKNQLEKVEAVQENQFAEKV